MKKIILIYIFLSLNYLLYTQWNPITPIGTDDIHDIQFIDANTGFAVGERSGKGVILKTTNGGTSWAQVFITNGNGLWIYSVYFVNSTTGFACGELGYVRRTTDAGNTWSSLQLTDKELSCIRFINANTGLTCGDNNSTNRGPTFKTTDAGISWTQVNNSVAHMDKIFYYDINTVYASGDYVVFKSTNGGSTWVDIYPGNSDCNDVVFLNNNTGFACGNYVMLKTTNAGVNWSEFLISPADTNYHACIYFTDNNNGYIPIINLSTFAGKIYKTTNSGTTWLLQQNLSGYAESINFINQNTGFACGGGEKIWKTTNAGGPIGIQPISTEIPKNFSLSQNYPNPFNPTTRIRLDVPKTEIIKIITYDVMGKEISVLVNEQLKPGVYEVSFDGSNCASGVYFYKLIASNYFENRKMILIK